MSSPAISFLLQTHRDSSHLRRLCAVLSQFSHARIFLHHDYSQSDLPDDFLKEYDITQVVPHRVTEWGRTSLMLAELDVLRLAFENMPEAEWFILVSGSCYPIKPVSYIEDFLRQESGDGFLDTIILDRRAKEGLHSWWNRKVFTKKIGSHPFISRYGKFYWRDLRIPRIPNPFRSKWQFCFGSQWFMLRRPAVEWLLAQDPHSHELVHYINQLEISENSSFAPDECLLQTLFHTNKNLRFSTDNHRYIDWENAKNWHPNTLTLRHYNAIRQSSALFARKFDPQESAGLLDRIDHDILSRS